MLKEINQDGRAYIREHYLQDGALHCARHTGLTINQVWGLAYRLGLTTGARKGQHHTPHRERTVHSQSYRHPMEYHALQQALGHFTATLPTTPEPSLL